MSMATNTTTNYTAPFVITTCTTTALPTARSTTYASDDTALPATHYATTNGRWTRTTLDSFGRTVKVEPGDATSTKSVKGTVYGSCGCSLSAKSSNNPSHTYSAQRPTGPLIPTTEWAGH